MALARTAASRRRWAAIAFLSVPRPSGLVAGRRLIVRGVRASDGQAVVVQATLVAVHAVDAKRCELEITPPLADALRRDSVVVHGNVALASHGEAVSRCWVPATPASPFRSSSSSSCR